MLNLFPSYLFLNFSVQLPCTNVFVKSWATLLFNQFPDMSLDIMNPAILDLNASSHVSLNFASVELFIIVYAFPFIHSSTSSAFPIFSTSPSFFRLSSCARLNIPSVILSLLPFLVSDVNSFPSYIIPRNLSGFCHFPSYFTYPVFSSFRLIPSPSGISGSIGWSEKLTESSA